MNALSRLVAHAADPRAAREELAREDPDFQRVRDVHHAALNALAASRAAEGLAIRRERQFWERTSGR